MKISNFELPDSGLVLIAGRPGIGKSYVVLEMANDLNQKGIKPVLLYADGQKSHSSFHYENGVVRESPSKLSRVKKVYLMNCGQKLVNNLYTEMCFTMSI